MKNLILCSLLLLFLSACSNESDLTASGNTKNEQGNSVEDIAFPLNPKNPYDQKGKRYYEAMQEFYLDNKKPQSIDEIQTLISFLNNFNRNKLSHKSQDLGYTTEEIAAILSNPSIKLVEIVNNSLISSQSKSQLISFIEYLIEQQNLEYIEIRDFIIAFDSNIISDTAINDVEKETILTVSTITSYALYAEAERKDRDWETSVGHKKTAPISGYVSTLVSIIAQLQSIVN